MTIEVAPPIGDAMTAPVFASPVATVPLIEHIRTVADGLSLQGLHSDEVSSLVTRLERELLPHELVGDGRRDSPIGPGFRGPPESPLSLRIHAEIELQVVGLRSLEQIIGSDTAHLGDIPELRGRLYGLCAAIRLHAARADFEGPSTLPATVPGQRSLGMMISHDESKLIGELTERLTKRFSALSSATVNSTVADVVHRFDGRPVRDFVPLLVERSAKSQLMILDAA